MCLVETGIISQPRKDHCTDKDDDNNHPVDVLGRGHKQRGSELGAPTPTLLPPRVCVYMCVRVCVCACVCRGEEREKGSHPKRHFSPKIILEHTTVTLLGFPAQVRSVMTLYGSTFIRRGDILEKGRRSVGGREGLGRQSSLSLSPLP